MNSPEIDARLDQLNDQGKSYTQAYAELGLTPLDASTVSADVMERNLAATTAREQSHAENMFLYRQTGPIELSAEAIAKNALHFEAIRQANQKRSTEK